MAMRILHGHVNRGATVVFGDLTDPASLIDATRGIDVVVSAVRGGPDVVADGQVALARAARANGAWRILPSDFALDVFQTPSGRRPSMDWRRQTDERIASLDIEHVHILSGAFLDEVDALTFDHRARKLRFWGDGHQEFDVTTIEDTARVVARAALDPDLLSRTLTVVGDRISPLHMGAVVHRITDRAYEISSRGSVTELEERVARARALGRETEHDRLAYLLGLAHGNAAVPASVRELYPDLPVGTFEGFMKRRLGSS